MENWENAIFSAPPLGEMALALQACQQTPQKLFSEPFANINSDQGGGGGKKGEKLPPGREFPIGRKKLTFQSDMTFYPSLFNFLLDF